jgi:hypothetical protein
MWSIAEVADFFNITRKLARNWIVNNIDGFHLRRIGYKVVVEITTDQMLKLIDLKRPMYGTDPQLDAIFDRERQLKTKASVAGVLARARKREQRQQQP